eukprot:1366921-Amorphochlora_amoeboformis.AAC.1
MVVDRRPHSRVLMEGEGEAGDGGSPGPSARGEATWGGTTGRPGAWVRTDERNARSKLDPERKKRKGGVRGVRDCGGVQPLIRD